MAARDWLEGEPGGSTGLVRNTDGRRGLAEGVGAQDPGRMQPLDDAAGGGMPCGKGGTGVGCSPWSRMWPPPGQRYKGRCSAPSSLQTAPLPGPLGWGQGQPQGCHVPIPAPNYLLTHEPMAWGQRGKTPRQIPCSPIFGMSQTPTFRTPPQRGTTLPGCSRTGGD